MPKLKLTHPARAPIGYTEWCESAPRLCQNDKPMQAVDVVLSPKIWQDLVRVNKWVNDAIKPVTDMDHWGIIERWDIPTDGKGDCEDYVLLKRKMLLDAGWPRSALLITVVRDKRGDGHAVLTVRTDKGDFVLDNQEEQVLLWSETGYRFVNTQNPANPGTFVAIDSRGAPVEITPQPANDPIAALLDQYEIDPRQTRTKQPKNNTPVALRQSLP